MVIYRYIGDSVIQGHLSQNWLTISLVLYNIYFFFIFSYFLKNYYEKVSDLKKKLFKILSYFYIIAALISAIVLLGISLEIKVYSEYLLIGSLFYIYQYIAPIFGVIYILVFLPFPFLKKFKWSIFYIEKKDNK
jgi:hypothetical protein